MNGELRHGNWESIRNEVRTARRRLWNLAYKVPHSFTIRKDNENTRIYFMSSTPTTKENSMFAVDFPTCTQNIATNPFPTVPVPWNHLLPNGFLASMGSPSKEEELQMERKRLAPSGITSYDMNPLTARFIFSTPTALYTYCDVDSNERMTPQEIPITICSSAARLNPELCPCNSDLFAFVADGDLFVTYIPTGQELQLTFTVGTHYSFPTISAGFPSYIMQEEFNRFQGYWWYPVGQGNVYQILYEEVDESGVGMISLLVPPGSEREDYKFPVAGSKNAKSRLRIAQFMLENRKLTCIKIKDLTHSLEYYFPWAEYMVRAGWTPGGHFIWVQLLDRKQERLELILVKPPNDGELANVVPPPHVLYAEFSANWINVHDILDFCPYEGGNEIEFLWASEETGFRHLYRISSLLLPPLDADWATSRNPAICLSPTVTKKVQLTSGKWEVVNTPIAVDYDRGLVYFTGLMNCPLESHLYVISLVHKGTPHRLTELGSTNSAYISLMTGNVILSYSNLTTPPKCVVSKIKYSLDDPSQHREVKLEDIALLYTAPRFEVDIPQPLVNTHELGTGETLYSVVYRPFGFDESKKYPTVLHVYGGPEVQIVQNTFKSSPSGQLWLYLFAMQGYCVVSIDSRGSSRRGVHFEGHIRRRLGKVELEDQVLVLKDLAERYKYIDMRRVAIYGWSYGGYLALLGLAQYPAIFKLAVAGAPVTSWELYDTGYTERYMGLPDSNYLAYQQSSVLSYISQFPEEENRLLIIHGLRDENVHFTHTTKLISALVKAGKPYTLQIYPNERHSLRRLEASEHYETALITFLKRHL